MLTIITLVLSQFVYFGCATVMNGAFPEMAMAVSNPSKILAAPKRPSPQAANPDFVSSDATYWLTDYTYSGASCDSKVVMKIGLATGYCFQTGSSSSLKYTCTSETSCTATVYANDATCTTSTNVSPFTVGNCESTDADDDGYLTDDGATFTKKQVLAVRGYPSAFSDGSSGLMSYYESQACAQNYMYFYRVGYENHCYSNFDGTVYTSTKYTNPNLNAFMEKDCISTNVVETTPVPSGYCQINGVSSAQRMTYYGKDNKNSLSAGAIAGIVIGTVAAVAIVAALLHFFVFNKAKAPMSQQGATGANNL